jgi:hypothetical protein
MNNGKDTSAIFKDPQTLLSALHHCLNREEKFPATVLKLNTDEWAVPLGPLEDFADEAKKLGWKHRVATGKLRGDPFPLERLIVGEADEWCYRDPHAPLSGADGRRDNGRVLITRYDPHAQSDYLLAASGEEGAARLLRVLTGLLAQGLSAVSLSAEGQLPFDFFWRVTAERPPMTALHAAARAWWGPIGQGDVTIYKQWPYDWEIADRLLHRVPWNVPRGVVLLGKDSPQVIKLAPSPGGTFERELSKVARLRVGEVRLARASDADTSNRFYVNLRLLPSGLLRRLPERITELERQIKAKQLLLERMRDEELLDEGKPEPLPQPLFLYYPERDRPLELPSQLRRLLVEWAGQLTRGRQADLSALRYLKLNAADSFPPGLDGGASEVHVLTTAAALGEEVDVRAETVGLQLLDYQPRSGGLVWFELLPEWAEHQLHLFAPHERRLNLYPRFQPSPYAAGKLGHALFGAPTHDWRRHVFLLVPTTDGQLSACHIPKAQFRPFVNAVEWECALDVDRYPLKTVETRIKQHSEQMVATLEESFTGSAVKLAKTLLSRRRQELRADIMSRKKKQTEIFDRAAAALEERTRQEQKKLSERREELDTLHEQVEQIESSLAGLGGAVQSLQETQDELLRVLNAAHAGTAEAQGLFSRHKLLVAELKRAEDELSMAKAALREWRAK